MIPGIAEILEMFKAGECTMTQALGWIEQHMANADLRDHFAGQVAQGMMGGHWPSGNDMPEIARRSWLMADAMIQGRSA